MIVKFLIDSEIIKLIPFPKEISMVIFEFIYSERKIKEELLKVCDYFNKFKFLKSLYLSTPLQDVITDGKYNSNFFASIQNHKEILNKLNLDELKLDVRKSVDKNNYEFIYLNRIKYMDYMEIIHLYEERFVKTNNKLLDVLHIIHHEYNSCYLDSLLLMNDISLEELTFMTHKDKYIVYLRL